MNSLQGGWGIQDRHDRVISWLSGVVVCLLILYAVIFVGRHVLPGKPPPLASTPPTTAPRVTPGPLPPTRTVRLPPPSRAPVPTRSAPLATLRPTARPATRPVAPTRVVPPRPSPSPRPTRPTPTPTRGTARPTRVAPPTPAASPTRRVPRPSPAPTRRPASVGPFFLRVGEPFTSGSTALAFARNHDVDHFQLIPESQGADSRLHLDAGPFDSRAAALAELARLRSEVRDQGIPIVIRGAGDSPSPSPTRRVTPPTPAPTRRTPPPTRRVTPPPTRRSPPTPGPTRSTVATRPLDPGTTRVDPSRRPNIMGVEPERADEPLLTVSEAQERLRREFSWRAPSFAGWTVQVSSFRRLTNAMNFRKHLEAKGYEASVAVAEVRGGAYFRVYVGVHDSIEAARATAERFVAQHGSTYQVFVRRP